MDYIIGIPTETGDEEFSFPDTENMYSFLALLSETGTDISEIIIPEGGLV